MTVEEFFIRPDNHGCRNFQIPGLPVDGYHNQFIFYQNRYNISITRQKGRFDARGLITREDMQAFLDMKIGITELWLRCTEFSCENTNFDDLPEDPASVMHMLIGK